LSECAYRGRIHTGKVLLDSTCGGTVVSVLSVTVIALLTAHQDTVPADCLALVVLGDLVARCTAGAGEVGVDCSAGGA